MAVITGKFEGFKIVKQGTGKKGPWSLYSLLVDGKGYGFGFKPPKFAAGSTIKFSTVTNDKGYEDADPDSVEVLNEGSGTTEAQTGTSTATNGSDPRQASIEHQVIFKGAVDITTALISTDGVPKSLSPADMVKQYVSLLKDIFYGKDQKPKAQQTQQQAAAADTIDY